MRPALLTSVVVSALATSALAHAEPPAPAPARHHALAQPADQTFDVLSPRPELTFPWLLTQLVPSPEIALARGDVTLGARWQLTPVLYSFGTHRRVTRWRSIVVDPLARVSGSLELHVTPEYVGGDVDRLLMRYGVRAYFPLLHRGEYLSVSIGTSTFVMGDRYRVSYDAGIYVLNGILGLELNASPAYGPLAGVALIKIRYF